MISVTTCDVRMFVCIVLWLTGVLFDWICGLGCCVTGDNDTPDYEGTVSVSPRLTRRVTLTLFL